MNVSWCIITIVIQANIFRLRMAFRLSFESDIERKIKNFKLFVSIECTKVINQNENFNWNVSKRFRHGNYEHSLLVQLKLLVNSTESNRAHFKWREFKRYHFTIFYFKTVRSGQYQIIHWPCAQCTGLRVITKACLPDL